ncbi:DUF7674 family protein [Hazenella coriacea]|uniref:DUF7674 domain-containing protein n=1 Tax=Hazenella coriacea TaxID=1179467 RepID=A0A4R3LAR2_9BACL|nr:hypothetical protein [Hazenella coriacea]TCS96839.1 hypothetical protein EDD58_101484 [Hazenella coriacea]
MANKERAIHLNYENIIFELLKKFPEYNEAYKEHIRYNGELLPSVFVGETLNEDLVVWLEEHIEHNKLKKVFEFLEIMATEGDMEVKELLSTTILERLGDNPKLLKEAYIYMGENTKKESEEIERFWGRD